MAENVWDSIRKGQEAILAPQLAQLQQATGAASLMQTMQKMDVERGLRSSLAGLQANATPDQISAAVRPYASSDALLKLNTDSESQRLTREATKESARARLQQAESIHNQDYQLKLRGVTTTEQKAALDAWDKAVRAQIAGERLKYDTGATVPIAPPALQGQLGPQVGKVTVAPTVTVAELMRMPPEDRAAAMASLQGGGQPPAASAPPVAATPSPAPVEAPVAAPVAPAQAIPPQGDMRDVMAARGQFGSATPAAPAAPAAAPLSTAAVAPPPTMPTFVGSPKSQEAARNKWLLDQAKPSNAGNGLLSNEALTLAAQQYLAGDPRAATGYARDIKTKSALMNEIAKQAKEQGVDGKLLAATMGEYEGFRAGQRTIGTREAQLSIAADVTSKFVPIAIERSEQFDRTGWKTLNDIQIAVDKGTASPELRRFAAANNALINVYARAINPQGVGTVSDKDHAREILNTAFSKGDYRAGAEQLKQEVDTELQAPGSVKRDMRERFTGKTEAPQNRRASDQPGAATPNESLRKKYGL